MLVSLKSDPDLNLYPNGRKTSESSFKKLFMSNWKLAIHIYCPKYERYLGEQQTSKNQLKKELKKKFKENSCVIKCECEKECKASKPDENSFVTIDIAHSLKRFMINSDSKLMMPRERKVGEMTDVMDGEMYENSSRN